MKTITPFLLLTCMAAGLPVLAADPPSGAPTNEAPAAPATNLMAAAAQPPGPAGSTETFSNAAPAAVSVTNNVAGTNAAAGSNAVAAAAAPAEPPVVVENGADGLRLNFHNAPLNLVLDYLSDAAGFIINREADVRGTVDVQGKNLTKEEAVAVLNSALKRNGYAIVRNGRILTIIAQDTAAKGDLPIEWGPPNPASEEKGSEMVTRIIPVKYASVSQLVPNLELLLPNSATLSANESANSLILVATKTDIKRMLTIINALDTSIASVSSIKVIPLQHADAKDTATLITTLFASQGAGATSAGGRPSFFSMFGRGGFPGGPPGFGGRGDRGGSSSSGSPGGAAAKNVVAVGDDRSNSIIISAPADLLSTIEDTVKQIDQEVTDVTELRVFRLVNADPTEITDQIAQLFPDTTGSTGSSSQGPTPFFFNSRFSRSRGSTTSTAADSDRAKKMGRVLAVPDPRTSSIIVMASKTIMPQIADMITELDADPGRKEVVRVYDLQNADPQDVQQALQDLFNRNTRMNNNNQNTMLNQNNPLNRRLQQSTQNMGNNSSGFGSSSGRRSSTGISGF